MFFDNVGELMAKLDPTNLDSDVRKIQIDSDFNGFVTVVAAELADAGAAMGPSAAGVGLLQVPELELEQVSSRQKLHVEGFLNRRQGVTCLLNSWQIAFNDRYRDAHSVHPNTTGMDVFSIRLIVV